MTKQGNLDHSRCHSNNGMPTQGVPQEVIDEEKSLPHSFIRLGSFGSFHWLREWWPGHSPPPVPDFGVSISPHSASAVLGNTTSAVTISISPQNGFSSPVTITMQGIPQGVDAMPSSSFSIDPGTSQTISFSLSTSAMVGTFPVTVLGTSGDLSHSTQLLLTTEPIVSVRAFQSGSALYLESSTNTDTARIGLEAQWGGSIVEVSLNGTNFVNMHATGREIQAAQYDGNAQYDFCAGCTGAFGWNPVQGGDKYNQGSPVLAQTLTRDSLSVASQRYANKINWLSETG